MLHVSWTSSRLPFPTFRSEDRVAANHGDDRNRRRRLISARRSTRMCARAPDVDVAVVGGGPGGLAAAAAIKSALGADATVKVIAIEP